MSIIIYLVFLCSNFLLIKSQDHFMIIDVKPGTECIIYSSNYTFTDGQNITLIVTSPMFINYGWWQLLNVTAPRNLSSELKTIEKGKPISYASSVNKSMEGIWGFKFLLLRGDVNVPSNHLPREVYEGLEYSQSVCSTNIKIAPKPIEHPSQSIPMKFIIIVSVVGTALVSIIIAQAAYIIFLKKQARKLVTLNTHNNLSKKTEPAPNDTARYCSNPGQKMRKAATPVDDDDNRDSVIYEAPNIEISGNVRMPIQPPQPPATTTIPRTPRAGHNMNIGPQAMLGDFQRPKLDREINLANRPPLPLPTHGHQSLPHPGLPHPGLAHPGHPHNNMFQEIYEEMETDAYEPPPSINTMPTRLPMPPKKVPTGNLLDVKENTLKMRQGNKPSFTQKPQQPQPNIMTANEFEQILRRRNNDTMKKPNPGHMSSMQQEPAMRRRLNTGDAQTNELEEAFRRRNNVKQVPIGSIPEPSSRVSPNPRPPPAVKSKPRGPPIHQPMQEEIYYNENQASSDEEWTYEPLKPLNSYEKNLYNV